MPIGVIRNETNLFSNKIAGVGFIKTLAPDFFNLDIEVLIFSTKDY